MADCNNLIVNMCGTRGVVMPETSCKQLRLEGVDDVTINQGIGIDLADGVHAYDGDGNEIEVVIDPNEIDKCDVGIHSVKYTATGKGDSVRPTACGKNAIDIGTACDDLTSIEAVRTVTIEQIGPPTISGVEDMEVVGGTVFDPMDGVSAIDGNGNSVDVEFEGEYPASASGKIATFNNESSKPLRSLKVTLEPIQDLHGYDKPWAGGSGDNLFPYFSSGTLKGVTYTVATDGTVTLNGTCTGDSLISFSAPIEAGAYTLCDFAEGTFPSDGNARTQVYIQGAFFLATANNSAGSACRTATCSASGDAQFRIRIESGHTYNNCKLKPMLVKGTFSTLSYEPYSNICPISGHTEVDAYVTGKNLANADALLDLGTGVTYSDEDGYYFPRHYDSGGSHPLFVGGERFGQITLSYKQKQSTSGNAKGFLRIIYTDGTDDRVPVSGYTANTWRNLSVTSNANKTVQMVRYSYNISGGECWMKDIQVELGNSVTAYEPYDAETYHTGLGQTVYGGVLDLVAGRLEVNRGIRTVVASDVTSIDTTFPHLTNIACSADDKNKGQTSFQEPMVLFDRLVAHGDEPFLEVGEVVKDNHADDYGVWLNVGTLEEARALLVGTQIVYPLAEPEVYQLTPQQINAFIGTNNVWADDSDNVEVVYTKALPQSGSVKYPDGVYYITYTAEDECGNKTEATRRIVVGDGNKLCTMRLCEGFVDCSQSRTCEAYTCRAYTACE